MTNEQNEITLEDIEQLEARLTPEEEEVMEKIEHMDEVTVTVEERGFWKEHGATVGKTTGAIVSAAGIFTGGFFTGKYAEKKKRKLFMQETERILTLIYANKKGEESITTHNGVETTEGYSVEDTAELIEVIQTKFLQDKKINSKEKTEWIELMSTLAAVGSYARGQETLKGMEIIKKSRDEENAKNEKANKDKKADNKKADDKKADE